MKNVKRLLTEKPSSAKQPGTTAERQIIGKIVGVDDDNRPLVDFQSNRQGQPIPALSLITLPLEAQASLRFPVPALLCMVGDNIEGTNNPPIIVGILHEHLFSEPTLKQAPEIQPDKKTQELKADLINIEGNEEIQFHCGKSSLSLKKNGQVVIKGENITNRARGNNKIKGASVLIN